VADPRFRAQPDRARNQKELAQLLEPRFLTRTAAEWLEEMDRRGVPCAPINSYADVFADPHVEAMGLARPLTLPNGVETRTTGFPVQISDYTYAIDLPPPRLGEHTESVFEEWLPRQASNGPLPKKVAAT
jgi:succinate--hydroxymethylglutarate CoA-transferase